MRALTFAKVNARRPNSFNRERIDFYGLEKQQRIYGRLNFCCILMVRWSLISVSYDVTQLLFFFRKKIRILIAGIRTDIKLLFLMLLSCHFVVWHRNRTVV